MTKIAEQMIDTTYDRQRAELEITTEAKIPFIGSVQDEPCQKTSKQTKKQKANFSQIMKDCETEVPEWSHCVSQVLKL